MHDRTVFFSLISLIIISTLWWIYADVWKNGSETSVLEKKMDGIEKNFLMMAQIEDTYDEVKNRHTVQTREFDSLKATIPGFETYAEVLQSIRAIANKQAIKIESFLPEMDDSFPALKTKLNYTGKHIERRPIQLRLYGNYLTIGLFLEEILRLEKTVNIHSIHLETVLNESEILSCDLVLFAYIYFDEYKKT
ncbi:MAG: type 4a pilus biogenesis protein PilO [Bacteroidetes bacterium]|nr:type 4a pilus biogenesis protein PilO [Bacteroidota bacterium]